MKFKEIIKSINNSSLKESEEVPSILGRRKEWMNLRQVNREKKTKEQMQYADDKRYQDWKGTQWLNTTARDMLTICMAAIDGMADTKRYGMNHEKYMSINSVADLLNLLKSEGSAGVGTALFGDAFDYTKRTFDQSKFFDIKDGEEFSYGIWGFISYYLNKKEITVYRGLTVDDATLNALYDKDELARLNPQRLISQFSNEKKEFNSFSVDPNVSMNFAAGYSANGKEPNQILIQGIANKQDINWAFTAYLVGRHNTLHEAELNINNIRTLKDLHIVKNKSKLNTLKPLSLNTENINKFISEFNNKKLSSVFKHRYLIADSNDKVLLNMDNESGGTSTLYFPVINSKIISADAYSFVKKYDNTFSCAKYNGTNNDYIDARSGKKVATGYEFNRASYYSMIIIQPANTNELKLFNTVAANYVDLQLEGKPQDIISDTKDRKKYLIQIIRDNKKYTILMQYDLESNKAKVIDEFNKVIFVPPETYIVTNENGSKFYNTQTGLLSNLPNDYRNDLTIIEGSGNIYCYKNTNSKYNLVYKTDNGYFNFNNKACNNISTVIRPRTFGIPEDFNIRSIVVKKDDIHLLILFKNQQVINTFELYDVDNKTVSNDMNLLNKDILEIEVDYSYDRFVLYNIKTNKFYDDIFSTIKQNNGIITAIPENGGDPIKIE